MHLGKDAPNPQKAELFSKKLCFSHCHYYEHNCILKQ